MKIAPVLAAAASALALGVPAQTRLHANINKAAAGTVNAPSLPQQLTGVSGAKPALFLTAELTDMGRELVRIRPGAGLNDAIDVFDINTGAGTSEAKVIAKRKDGTVIAGVRTGSDSWEVVAVGSEGTPSTLRKFRFTVPFLIDKDAGVRWGCGVEKADGVYFVRRVKQPQGPDRPIITYTLMRATDSGVTELAVLPHVIGNPDGRPSKLPVLRTDGSTLFVLQPTESEKLGSLTTLLTKDCTKPDVVKRFAFEDTTAVDTDEALTLCGKLLLPGRLDRKNRLRLFQADPTGGFGPVRDGQGKTVQDPSELTVISADVVVLRGDLGNGPRLIKYDCKNKTFTEFASIEEPSDIEVSPDGRVVMTAKAGSRRALIELGKDCKTIRQLVDPTKIRPERVLGAFDLKSWTAATDVATAKSVLVKDDGTKTTVIAVPGPLGDEAALTNKSLYVAVELGTSSRPNTEAIKVGTDSNTVEIVEVRPTEPANGSSFPGLVAEGDSDNLYTTAFDGSDLDVQSIDSAGNIVNVDTNPTGPAFVSDMIRMPNGVVFGFDSSKLKAGVKLFGTKFELVMKGVDPLFLQYLRSFSNGPSNAGAQGYLLAGIDAKAGNELLFYDLADDTVSVAADINPGAGDSNPQPFVVRESDELVAVPADDGKSGFELHVYSPRTGKVFLLKDIRPGSIGSAPDHLTFIGDTLFFVADDGTTGREVWKSDLTTTGTVRITDLDPGRGKGFKGFGPQLVAFAGRVWYGGGTVSTGNELVATDGTAAGTKITELRPGTRGSSPTNFVVAGGRLFFTANDGTNGTELWCHDGTKLRQFDLLPGSGSSQPLFMTAIGNRVAFAAVFEGAGRELGVSDGTDAGTGMAVDVRPGPLGSAASGFTLVDGKLVFNARDDVHGNELFVVDRPGATAETIGEPCGRAGPRLAATPPVLGGKWTISGRHAPKGMLAILTIGGRAKRPVPAPCGCFSHVDLGAFFVEAAFLVTTPDWKHVFTMPNDVAILSLPALAMQAFFFKTAPPFDDVMASNGVVFRIDAQ